MKTIKEKYDRVKLLLQLGEIDLDEYMELMGDIGAPEIDLDDFEPDGDGEPQHAQDLEPKEPLNDFKPEEIGRYKREYLGKNWQNTRYYY